MYKYIEMSGVLPPNRLPS